MANRLATIEDNAVLGAEVSFGDTFNFAERLTRDDRIVTDRTRALQEAREDLGFADFLRDVAQADFLHNALADMTVQQGFEFDPAFRPPDLDSPEGERLYAGIPEHLLGRIQLSNSLGQAQFMANEIRRELEIERRLSQFGGFGLAGRIFLNFTDPSAIAIALLSGPAALVTKVSRFQRFARVGLISGGINAAFEAGVVGGSPTRDTYDILYAGLLGFALGGGISLFRSVPPSGLEFRGRPGVVREPRRLTFEAEKFDATVERYKNTVEAEEAETFARGDRPDSVEELVDIDNTIGAKGHPEINFFNPNGVSLRAVPPTPLDAGSLVDGAKFIVDDVPHTITEINGPKEPVITFNTRDKVPRVFKDPEDFNEKTGLKINRDSLNEAARNRPIRNAVTVLDELRESAGEGRFDTDQAVAIGLLDNAQQANAKGLAGIFTKGGRSLDFALESLTEKGFFRVSDTQPTDLDLNDLVTLVSRDIDALFSNGPRLRSPTEEDFFGLSDHEARMDELRQMADETPEEQAEQFRSSSVGAAQVSPEDIDAPLQANFPSDWDFDPFNPKARVTRIRYDVSAILSGADSAMVRDFGKMVREGTGFIGTDFIHVGASEDALQRSDAMRNRMMQSSFLNYRGWLKVQGRIIVNETVTFKQDFDNFHEGVGRAIVGEIPDGPGAEFISAHANDMRPILAEMLFDMKRFGVYGAENIAPDPNYLPRRVNYNKFSEAVARYGEKRLADFFEEAMVKDIPGFIGTHYKAIAKAYVTRFRERAAGMEESFVHGLNLSDEGMVRDFLTGLVSDDIIDDLILRLQEVGEQRGKGQARPTALKRRIRFNELHRATLQTKFEGPQQLNFNDLFVRNSRILIEQYLRVMSGHIAMAKRLGITSRRDFDKRIEALNAAKSEGANITKTQIATIKVVYNHILGNSLEAEPGSFMANLGRFLRDYQYTRVGGVMGLSQMPDLGDILSPRLFRSFLVHMPEMKAMLKRMQNGQLEDPLARKLEFIGVGGDALRNNAIGRFDEQGYGTGYGPSPDSVFDAAIQRGADLAARGTRLVHFGSGMAFIDTVMRRTVGKSILQEITDVAFGFTKRKSRQGRFVVRRLMVANGIPERKVTAVLDAVRETAVVVDSMLARGKKIADINLSNIKDLDIRDLLVDAIVKEVNIRVMRPDIGGLPVNPVGEKGRNPLLADSTLFKIVLQFQKFVINAYSVKTLRAIVVRDVDTLGRFFGSMLWAGLSYMIYTYLQTTNNPERRKKMLATDKVAAAVFARSGYSSVIPGVYDSTVGAVFEPVFSYSRSSGLAKDFFTGNPTFESLDTAHQAFAGLIQALLRDGYQFSQKDIRNFRRLMFFQNMTGISQVLDLLENVPPESSRTDF